MSAVARTDVKALQAQAPQEEGDYPKLQRKLNTLDRDFLALLGSREAVDRFKRVVLNAVSANPKLLACNPRSLLGAAMKAAQDGLMPDGRECVLNIYNTKQKDAQGRESWEPTAQYLPMVAGLMKKLYEAGATYVDAAAVYEKDEFIYERGDNVRLLHRPYLATDPGAIVAAYVVVKMGTGETKREVMPRRDIDKIREASKAKDKGPWVDWFDQMAIKSVIKRAYKQLPNTPALDKVIEHDNEAAGLSALPQTPYIAHQPTQQLEHRPAQGVDFDTGEITDRQDAELQHVETKTEPKKSAKSGPNAAEVGERIWSAKTLDELDAARSLISGFADDIAESLRKDADTRAAQLGTKELI
jgi:recombination protein RecT